MPKMLVSTIGFDEKFTIRAIIRYLDELESFVGILATPVDERVLQAVNNIKSFIDRYMKDANKLLSYSFIEIDVSDPYSAISRIKRLFSPEREYILNLSGGMRALVITTLIAFVISRASGIIEIELENFKERIVIDPKVLVAGPLSGDEKKIVNIISRLGKATYKEIMKETNIPRATLFKILSSLISKEIIRRERVDRTSYYMLTDIGRAYADTS